MEKISGVYQIKNKINQHRYIGSSVNIQKRWGTHKNRLHNGTHHNQILQRAYDKYGEDAFVYSIRMTCPRSDTIKYEQAHLDKIQPEYNIAKEASASMLGRKFTKEQKRKLSKAHIGIPLSEEHKRKIGEAQVGRISPMKGKRHTEEAKRKTSIALIGKVVSEETKIKMSKAMKGRQFTEEHRQKLSNAKKGTIRTEETKRKISDTERGKALSEEHKRNISIAQKKRWERIRGCV